MATTLTIDCYGNRLFLDQPKFNNIFGEKQPVLVDEDGGTTYIAFSKEEVGSQPIHQVIEAGTITTMLWGYGEWPARKTLEYNHTKNEAMTITVE